MESPFAAAQTIRDIGSYQPVSPYDGDEHRRAVDAWSARTNGPLPPQVRDPDFFGNSFFDSYLLGLEIGEDSLRITVDAEDALDFAHALDHLLGRPRKNLPWPVDLVMHQPSTIRFVCHDDSGTLMTIDEEPTIAPDDRATLVNEWFFSYGDRLGWVVEAYNLHVSFTSHLLVECASATAVDRRLDALVPHFGPAVVPLWNDARAHFKEPHRARSFWIEDDLGEYLAGRFAHYGLSRTDFLPV